MNGPYKSEEAAERRVAQLKPHGIWPGKRRAVDQYGIPDGSWELLYDPAEIAGKGISRTEEDDHDDDERPGRRIDVNALIESIAVSDGQY